MKNFKIFTAGILMILMGFTIGLIYSSKRNNPLKTIDNIVLVPADSQTPAAGTCLNQEKDIVTVTLPPDFVPVPRCTIVKNNQSLKIINNSGKIITGVLGQYKINIPSGNEQSIDAQFGTYLAPGVHKIPSGAEIWVQP